MTDDVLLNKAASIERCIARAREEFNADPIGFASNFTRQDAAVLNIQRACEAALDMGNHVIRRDKLGISQSSRDVFSLLEQAGRIDASTAEAMRKMVGFRNVAVHEYQALVLAIAINIITQHLEDFSGFSRALLKA